MPLFFILVRNIFCPITSAQCCTFFSVFFNQIYQVRFLKILGFFKNVDVSSKLPRNFLLRLLIILSYIEYTLRPVIEIERI